MLQTKEFNGEELMDFYKVAPVYAHIEFEIVLVPLQCVTLVPACQSCDP